MFCNEKRFLLMVLLSHVVQDWQRIKEQPYNDATNSMVEKYRVVEGNHRVSAYKQCLADGNPPNLPNDLLVTVYKPFEKVLERMVGACE